MKEIKKSLMLLLEELERSNRYHIAGLHKFKRQRLLDAILKDETRVESLFAELDGLQKEMLFDITTDNGWQPKARVETRIKLFVICYTTILQAIYILLNTVFELGLPNRSCTYENVINNKNLRESGILEVASRMKSQLKIEKYIQMRNVVVHEGVLPDEELSNITKGLNKLNVEAFSLLRTEHISDEEYKRRMIEYLNMLATYTAKKSLEFRELVDKTIECYNDIQKIICNRFVFVLEKHAVED